MKRKLRFAVLLTAIILLTIPLVIFLINQLDMFERPRENTKGEIVIVDGVPQNDRIYIESTRYDAEKGIIFYTVVNNSSRYCSTVPHDRWIEKKIDGEWQIYVDDAKFKEVLARPHLEVRSGHPAHKESGGNLLISDYWTEVTPGEYRIIINGVVDAKTEGIVGQHEVVEWSVSYPENGYCLVGYFTITEEMLAPAS